MADELDDFQPWTELGRARLLDAAARVSDAVAAHAAAVADADGDNAKVFRASEELLPVLLAYAAAQFDYTGTGFPFGVLAEFVGDDEGDDADPEPWPTTGLSVVQRHDYVVTDEEAVMGAGRAAYQRVWPEDSEADAQADVTHLGRALYQLAHADGWDSLTGVAGLEPVAGIVAVVKQDELLGPEPDDWASEVLDEDAEVIYSQADVFRPV